MRTAEHNKSTIAVTLVLFLLGALLMASVRTRVSSYGKVPSRFPVLAAEYLDAQKEIKRLKREMAALNEKIHKYETDVSETSRVVADMKRELDSDRVAMGYTKVTGPGIILTLDDSQRKRKPAPIVELQLDMVHDIDLLSIVNELRNAGAEAISVNGQRVVATTSIRCVGAVIRVNDVGIGNPYEIRAIGDPDTLESGLKIPGGALEEIQAREIRVKLQKEPEIIIPEYSGRIIFRHAKAIK